MDRWVEDYNMGHVNRDTGCTPMERPQPAVTRPLESKPVVIFRPKEERKVAKDHAFALDEGTYTWPSEPCVVAFRVRLHIHLGERLSVWHGEQLVTQLLHLDEGRLRDAPLTVGQVLEDILAATR